MLSPFKKVKLDDPATNRLQENIADVLFRLVKLVLLDGQLLTSIVLTTGTTNRVSHNLGRNIQGWIVVDKSATADIWRADYSAPIAPERLINLSTSANCTVSLYVF